MFSAIRNGDVELARKLIIKYKGQAAKTGSTLLLSCEAFVYYKNIFEQLDDVLNINKTAIIAFFRDPIERLLSSYNQAVKRHFQTLPLTSHCHEILGANNGEYSGLIFEPWVEHFKAEHVYIYQYLPHSVERTRLEYLFLQNIGIPEENHKGFICNELPVNVGYSSSALELKRLLNTVLRKDDDKLNKEIDCALQRYSEQSDELWPELSDMVDKNLYGELIEKFKTSNKYIKDNYIRGKTVGFLDTPHSNSSKKNTTPPSHREYSIKYAATQAFFGSSHLHEHIMDLISEKLTATTTDYNTLRLAEVFGFEISSHVAIGSAISDQQLKRVISEKAHMPDCLRELSLILEHSGKYEEAYQVISRALALRPEGPLIVSAHERLTKRLT